MFSDQSFVTVSFLETVHASKDFLLVNLSTYLRFLSWLKIWKLT